MVTNGGSWGDGRQGAVLFLRKGLLVILGLVWGTAALGGETLKGDHSNVERALLVHLCDGATTDLAVLRDLMTAVDLIYATAEVRIQWETTCEAPPLETLARTEAWVYLVAELPGAIRIRFQQQFKITNVMAYDLTAPADEPGPVIYVSIRSVAANASRRGSCGLTPGELARALGHVVAHELAHHFIQKKHTRNGILKNGVDRRDLLEPDRLAPYFSAQEVERLHRVLSGAAAR
jgi:hypothetical protein